MNVAKNKKCSCLLVYFWLVTLLITATSPIYSLDISFKAEQQFYSDQDNRVFREGEFPEIEYGFQSQVLAATAFHDFDTTDNEFSFTAGLSYNTDDTYSPPWGGKYYPGYFLLEEGGMKISQKFAGNAFDFNVGRFKLTDLIQSPYSLFISSNKNSAVTMDMQITSGHFFFRSQWLQLNKDSSAEAVDLNEYDNPKADDDMYNFGFEEGYPDRGANLRYYGLQYDTLRIGFVDASIYTEKSFDLEYFINPVPGILLQYATIKEGNPWMQNRDENYLFGFFIDYTQPDFYLYSQLFVDDVNMDFIFKESYGNPNKLAWSLGGTVSKPWGELGFYHAGATEYMFQSIGTSRTGTPYSYTYYPDVLFLLESGESASIPLEENYFGYLHGENNIAFMLTAEPDFSSIGKIFSSRFFDGLNLKGALEFVLSGSKSPVNPWGWKTTWEEGPNYFSMFSESPLEKRLQFSVDTEKKLSSEITIFCNLKVGYIWNRLQLEPGLSDERREEYESYKEYNEADDLPEYDLEYLYYYKPSSVSESIALLTLGIEYSFDPEDFFN